MDTFTIGRTFLMILFTVELIDSATLQIRPIFEATEEVIPILGNPFGGGTPEVVKRNMKEHVNNQQRIFDRERSERMKAQRMKMRSMKSEDSYLRAYHEQHEQFHIDLERKMMEQMKKTKKPEAVQNITKHHHNHADINKHQRNVKQNLVFRKNELKTENKIIHTTERARNKRLDVDFEESKQAASDKVSRSLEYAPGHFLPMRPQQTQYYASTNKMKHHQPAATAHYPVVQKFTADDLHGLTYASLNGYNDYKQFSQLSGYDKFNGDIETSLTSLIGKQPDDQLKGLTYLLQQSSANHKVTGEDLKNSNINLKASAIDVPQEYYETFDIHAPFKEHLNSYQQQVYAQGASYPPRDHTPITENEEETTDVRAYPVHTAPPTRYTYVNSSPPTAKSTVDYYNAQVGEQLKTTVSTASVNHYNPATSYISGHDNLHSYASQYEFGYHVRDPHSGNDFGHAEVSDGENAAGSYHVLLPDGRLQKVKYRAGPDGFKAQVTYD